VSALLLAIACASLPAVDPAATFLEWYELNSNQKRLTAAVAAVATAQDVQCRSGGCRVRTSPLAGDCGRSAVGSLADRLLDQPMMTRRGTAFLIAPDRMMTAGHVLAARHLCNAHASARTLRFVFDFRLEAADRVLEPGAEAIAQGDEVLSCDTDPLHDVAVVRLTRVVADRRPLTLSSARVDVGAPVWSVGYPLGLPVKYVRAAVVNAESSVLRADLDANRGSSGAPVFDATGSVIGLITAIDLPAAMASDSCGAIEYCRTGCVTSIVRVR
jgi:S1-C subfamily serine protease